MFFQIGSIDHFSFNYSRLLRRIRQAVQAAYGKEKSENGLTQEKIAEKLGVDRSTVSKRLKCEGNITLKSISDLYVAMGCEPLENFTVKDSYEWEDNTISGIDNQEEHSYLKDLLSKRTYSNNGVSMNGELGNGSNYNNLTPDFMVSCLGPESLTRTMNSMENMQ